VATDVRSQDLSASCTGRNIQRSLAIWEGPRKTQEQFNRRIADISGRVEPLNAKFADFLDQYNKEKMLAITLGLAPVESGCFRLGALALCQGGKKMALAGKSHPELTPVQTAIAGLLVAFTWDHPREKLPKQPRWDPRTVVYPTEIAAVMDVVKAGHYNTLSPDIGLRCGEIESYSNGWAQSVQFALLSCDQALKIEPQASAAGSSELTTHPSSEGKLASMSPDQVEPNKRPAAKEASKRTHGMTTRRQAQASDKGQESPAPVVLEEKASRAGGLRPAVGSGQKGTRVSPRHHPKT
jgi:hypothetical protein